MEKNVNELWDYLVDYMIATDDEIKLVCDINGYNLETLEDVLYSRTGYRTLEQVIEYEKKVYGNYEGDE